jgi:hypothetical protein
MIQPVREPVIWAEVEKDMKRITQNAIDRDVEKECALNDMAEGFWQVGTKPVPPDRKLGHGISMKVDRGKAREPAGEPGTGFPMPVAS